MPRRYKSNRLTSSELFLRQGLIALALIAAYIYFTLPPERAKYFLAACVLLLFSLSGLAIFVAMHTKSQRDAKLRALSMIDVDAMTGEDFEKYLAEMLKDRGYSKVRLTEKYDLGVDIIAEKDGVRWGIQAKRYKNLVLAAAVRQVVTALKGYNCQRSMVITNSVYSRPARELAASNECVLIGKDQLAEWIVAFQNKSNLLKENQR